MMNNFTISTDHYPKLLLQHELDQPLKVICDFFSADFPKGHHKRLEQWRYFVINDQPFSHPHDGPGALLFTHELNVKLLEAAYLLMQNHPSVEESLNIISTQLQRKQEIHQWLYYPKHLKPKEISKPYKVLTRLFKNFSLFEYRSFLHDWLTAAFDKRSGRESLDAREVIMVFENLQKLYDATWLIHQRETNATLYKHPKISKADKPNFQIKLNVLQSNPTLGEKLALHELAQIIRQQWPEVETIIHLGTSKDKEFFHFLLLTSDGSKLDHGELVNTIETQLSAYAEVHVLIHKTSAYKAGIQRRARFWLSANQCGKVLYGEDLPKLSPSSSAHLTNQKQRERAQFHWNRWAGQGGAFLEGSQYYYARDYTELAAFMLHQSMESTLKGIIQAVTGYRIMIHNISRILKISRLFTDDLFQLFDNPDGQLALGIIQSAYTESRYKNIFHIDSGVLTDLIEVVKKLYLNAQALREKHIDDLKH